MEIKIEELSKRFGRTVAVNAISLTAGAGKFIAVIGPSGAGKSTLLLMLAGLLAPDSGKISIGGELATSGRKTLLPPSARSVGMVFQSLALWPHMTARAHLEFALDSKPLSKEQKRAKAMETLEAFGISRYENSLPEALSAGERQRLALARTLVAEPKVLLLDEPFSNLDRHLIKKFLPELRQYHMKYGTTTVLVTHDQEAALAIADEVAVMSEGKLRQQAAPSELYFRPADAFVASFVGEGALMEAELSADGAAQTAAGKIPFNLASPAKSGKALLLIRPENLNLDPKGTVRGFAAGSEFREGRWLVTFECQGGAFLAYMDRQPDRAEMVSFAAVTKAWAVPLLILSSPPMAQEESRQ